MNSIYPIFPTIMILGTILVLGGTIRVFMTMFGIRAIHPWENSFKLKLPKIEVGVTTKNLGIAMCMIGLMLTMCTTFVAQTLDTDAALNRKPQVVRTMTRRAKQNYTVAEETSWLNLTERRSLKDMDRQSGKTSHVTWKTRLALKSVHPMKRDLTLPFATSGVGIRQVQIPTGAKFRKAHSAQTDQADGVYHPFLASIKKSDVSARLIKQAGRMRDYQLTIPLTGHDGQEVWYELAYDNAFQGEHEEWAGKIIHADTDTMTMNVTFPHDKPFKTIKAFREPAHGKVKIPINNPDMTKSPDRRYVTWTVKHAKQGERYFLKWEW